MEPSAVRIAHLSDLHFGANGQKEIWPTLRNFLCNTLKPNVILITGDIVDTPKRRLFEEAQKALRELVTASGATLLVCPGNHDRFIRGTRASFEWPWGKQFEFYFSEFAATKGVAIAVSPSLSVQVLSIDTTENTRFLARGTISESTLEQLRTSAGGAIPDSDVRTLRLLLMHHHLLPIHELESDRDRIVSPFLGATTCVTNPASVLSACSQGCFDLVLHGHEHAFNAARFASIANGSSPLTVISAPSATGTVTGKRCDPRQAQFNLLELDHDDTLWLQRYSGSNEKCEWAERGKRTLVLDDVSLRRAWHKRSASAPEQFAGARWFFDFRENNDVFVRRTYSELRIPEERVFHFAVHGAQSRPTDLRSWICDEEDCVRAMPDVAFTLAPNTRNKFEASIPLRVEEGAKVIPTFITEYRWPQGGKLTMRRLADTPKEDEDFFSRNKMECAFVGTGKPLHWIEIFVRIPQHYAPNRGFGGVRVYVKHDADSEYAISPRLTERLLTSGEGEYSLRLEYPVTGARYCLAWRVFDESASPTGSTVGR